MQRPNIRERVERAVQSAGYATRALIRLPSFAVTVVLTLAVGIGATTAMFSVLKGALFEPLPYPEPDRLIELVHEAPGTGIERLYASPAIYFAYRDHGRAFESVGLWDWDGSPVTVTAGGEPESVPSVEVTHEVLAMLGARPVAGRGFTELDDRPDSTPTVIVSYDFWQRRFGGGEILGRTLVVQGVPREVVGVLPRSFRFFEYDADIFYPLQLARSSAAFPAFDGRGIARLRPDVTLHEANADAARLIPILWEEFGRPGTGFENARFGPRFISLKDSVIGNLGDTLWLLMATIGMLLLIACANVANLMVVRAERRRQELAIRTALGAGSQDIARLALTESALLCLAGGSAGLAGAYIAMPTLLAVFAGELPDLTNVTVDSTAALFALGISTTAALLFALTPLIGRRDAQLARLPLGAGSMTDGPPKEWRRQAFVVWQVALALLLLIGSGLMVRTFQALQNVDPGFRSPDEVMTFQLTIAATAEDPDARRIVQIQQAIVDRLAAVPGVESAGFAAFNDGLPLDGDVRKATISVAGGRRGDSGERSVEAQFVSPSYLETLGTPLLAGSSFDWTDVYASRRAVLVSANLAHAEWGSVDAAIGKRIDLDGMWTVIGVFQDVHYDGVERPAPETVAFPLMTVDAPPGVRVASFVVRSERVGMPGFSGELRQAVWDVNGELAPANMRSLGDLYRGSMARTSVTLSLLATIALIALLLGLIGVYGVMSYSVSQRRREIGVRSALGGTRGTLLRMFIGRAMLLAGAGVVAGIGGAAVLTRLMASQLFGVGPLDPWTYSAAAVVLLATAALASYLPARRASVIEPTEALKAQ